MEGSHAEKDLNRGKKAINIDITNVGKAKAKIIASAVALINNAKINCQNQNGHFHRKNF